VGLAARVPTELEAGWWGSPRRRGGGDARGRPCCASASSPAGSPRRERAGVGRWGAREEEAGGGRVLKNFVWAMKERYKGILMRE
jgi:hypothetical protein